MTDRIKIVSDGTINGTYVYGEDGKVMPYVQNVEIKLSAYDQEVKATIHVHHAELLIEGELDATRTFNPDNLRASLRKLFKTKDNIKLYTAIASHIVDIAKEFEEKKQVD